jgi:signal transduction histidine kinase
MNDHLPGYFQLEKILVVDDTAYNLRLASGILQRKGYEVFPALDGFTALAKAAEILPDLILLDIKMRGIDGYEVCQKLKENPQTADIPVIFISGLDELGDKVKAFSCGGVDYITKPFQPVEVLLRVENQLNLRSLQRTLKEKNLLLEETLQELKQTQAQLIHTEKMASLGQFVAGIAHEINNPANFIQGNISHLRSYTSELLALLHLYQAALPNPPQNIQDLAAEMDLNFLVEDLAKILDSMKFGSERIKNIVNSLRNFSRLGEAKLKKVDLHEGLESSLMILQHRLEADGSDRPKIQVIKNYQKIPQVECYAGEINQVFINILTNAIDALTQTNPNLSLIDGNPSCPNSECTIPTIEISTELIHPDQVQITIADNGPGMTEKVRKQLFDPFFTTKPVGAGRGLGLSISYQTVVEGHQGNLYCQSTPGEGTTFKIILPLKQ